MPDTAWLLTANRENWLYCEKAKSFGLRGRPGRLRPAEVGDPLVAYVAGDALIAGLGTITKGLYHEESAIWPDAVYPHRVGIELQLDFDHALDMRRLVDDLSFVTDKAHWAVFFKGGARPIPLSDFELIKARLKQKKLREQGGPPDKPPGADADVRQAVGALSELQSSSYHDRLAEMVYLVGLRVGYDAFQRFKVHESSPYEIDAVWLEKGNPHVAVEVHVRGSLDEALNRLRHARDFNFRKVILVLADRGDLRRALSILDFDEKLKHWIDIWFAGSILEMYGACTSFYNFFRSFEQSTYREAPNRDLV